LPSSATQTDEIPICRRLEQCTIGKFFWHVENSRTPKWLSDLNYERPAESSVNIGLNYTSRLYEKPEHLPDWITQNLS